ncbi:microtubule-associated protein, MAP65/Ase1/PRC1 [Kipferlia bialata]|uniref:Microtubule-associated protein, MAP65/Ase1/PRC1 n=1 Tax=Kipferlia bialata TaxID=797122 RepID=A0A9K3CPI9_9EUKA|nr:microtubule-associated protein, MAP65/Ase1/PRC1 [Kipferlia bialata]|eukprot:g636.t1
MATQLLETLRNDIAQMWGRLHMPTAECEVFKSYQLCDETNGGVKVDYVRLLEVTKIYRKHLEDAWTERHSIIQLVERYDHALEEMKRYIEITSDQNRFQSKKKGAAQRLKEETRLGRVAKETVPKVAAMLYARLEAWERAPHGKVPGTGLDDLFYSGRPLPSEDSGDVDMDGEETEVDDEETDVNADAPQSTDDEATDFDESTVGGQFPYEGRDLKEAVHTLISSNDHLRAKYQQRLAKERSGPSKTRAATVPPSATKDPNARGSIPFGSKSTGNLAQTMRANAGTPSRPRTAQDSARAVGTAKRSVRASVRAPKGTGRQQGQASKVKMSMQSPTAGAPAPTPRTRRAAPGTSRATKRPASRLDSTPMSKRVPQPTPKTTRTSRIGQTPSRTGRATGRMASESERTAAEGRRLREAIAKKRERHFMR